VTRLCLNYWCWRSPPDHHGDSRDREDCLQEPACQRVPHFVEIADVYDTIIFACFAGVMLVLESEPLRAPQACLQVSPPVTEPRSTLVCLRMNLTSSLPYRVRARGCHRTRFALAALNLISRFALAWS